MCRAGVGDGCNRSHGSGLRGPSPGTPDDRGTRQQGRHSWHRQPVWQVRCYLCSLNATEEAYVFTLCINIILRVGGG